MCVKSVVVERKRAAFKLSHDVVAPSEYKAAYDQCSFPRSVFNKSGGESDGREVRASIIKRMFLKSKEKKEKRGDVFATPVIKVSVKRKAEPLQEIALNEQNADRRVKLSTRCLNTTESGSLKLPNAIANKIFKVLFLIILCYVFLEVIVQIRYIVCKCAKINPRYLLVTSP